MAHAEAHPLAGQEITIEGLNAGNPMLVKNWFDKVYNGQSWQELLTIQFIPPQISTYEARRVANNIPLDDEVVWCYPGVLVHQSELPS